MTLNFIDVSKHQGTIDWAKVAPNVDGVTITGQVRAMIESAVYRKKA